MFTFCLILVTCVLHLCNIQNPCETGTLKLFKRAHNNEETLLQNYYRIGRIVVSLNDCIEISAQISNNITLFKPIIQLLPSFKGLIYVLYLLYFHLVVAAGNTRVCVGRFEPADNMTVQHRGNISSRFSSNSEAKASALADNLKEMSLEYYMHSDVFVVLKSLNTQLCVVHRERVKDGIPSSLSTRRQINSCAFIELSS